MGPKSEWLVIVMLVFSFLASWDQFLVSAATWRTLDVNTKHVKDCGRFAVQQHNIMARKRLGFDRVVTAFGQLSGSIFNLKLVVKANDHNLYMVMMLENPNGSHPIKKLLSFNKITR